MATPVLMFMNMKGGVGKTTLAVEVSRTLAHYYGKTVLLIDYDPKRMRLWLFWTLADIFNYSMKERVWPPA